MALMVVPLSVVNPRQGRGVLCVARHAVYLLLLPDPDFH